MLPKAWHFHTSVVLTVIPDAVSSRELPVVDETVPEDSATKLPDLISENGDNLTPSDDASNLRNFNSVRNREEYKCNIRKYPSDMRRQNNSAAI